ncbi:hypothetical protein AB0N23_16190 [Streptomyces sp. NPDC052644]
MSTFVNVAGAIAAVVAACVAGWFSMRGSRAAARISAEPQAKQVDFTVLQASVDRLEKDYSALRAEMTRARSVLWSLSRWALSLRDQVVALGGEPTATPDDVEEYYRTGV